MESIKKKIILKVIIIAISIVVGIVGIISTFIFLIFPYFWPPVFETEVSSSNIEKSREYKVFIAEYKTPDSVIVFGNSKIKFKKAWLEHIFYTSTPFKVPPAIPVYQKPELDKNYNLKIAPDISFVEIENSRIVVSTDDFISPQYVCDGMNITIKVNKIKERYEITLQKYFRDSSANDYTFYKKNDPDTVKIVLEQIPLK